MKTVPNLYFPGMKGLPVKPFEKQVGGTHYKDYPIQPIQFIRKNRLEFIEGCVVKYICRYNKPGGKGIQDLEKIKHYVEMLIAFEEQKDGENLVMD